ncbi:DUF885 family protein [Erythrobacter arachoides]|uniref:DUF885 family protein n=1 Tax=Aurantiacibacter arachoides TaxID=1850444 RepID=A0A845A6Q5_9SPHN|nr:DUF885 domain-containing protein [Aurantiacibacter arachoides]MXO94607.1 DUF885 family protein [Aurantiacibacter arachoides]GGD62175.1 hypothetical protein GCM10011411_22980 [Aurantiacibacter arachoides]
MVRFTPAAALALALAGCATVPATADMAAADMAAVPGAPVQAEGIGALFDAYDAAQLELSPEGKAYRGVRDEDYGRWSDATVAADEQERLLRQRYLATMRADYDLADLQGQDALSYRLFEANAARADLLDPYREYGFVFDQMNGEQSGIPAFLINTHTVTNASDAAAYVSRIQGIGALMDQHIARSAARAANGIMPPRWVYPYVLSDITNLLDAGNDNAVLEDFAAEVARLNLPEAQGVALNAAAAQAWATSAVPAYQRLRAEMLRQQALAPTDDGVWRFPNGDQYYDALLSYYTTTDLSADEIHAIGLAETARIHEEMRAIMAQVGFTGTLQEFFEYTRTDPRFYYTTREEYLADVSGVLDRMTARLPEFFVTLPEYELQVKAVEAFREQSAGKAFYSSPAPDGSRPGTYYVNLYNLADMSRNELEALAYHEGLPGHHLQRAIQTGLGDLPPFRRFGGFTAYTEGWGLYSEELGKDMGFYTDPYSDFGRLGMELWRAGRLVVDTGIHDQRWSREQAIRWLTDNTPNPPGDIEKAIERYIVYPGQATAYMIGKLKIMELRERARTELGEDFDIRQFHEAVLTNGPVPLDILEEQVDQWIQEQKQG